MTRTENPLFTPEQKKLIKEHLLKDAPEFELERFYITCERTGLDPFSRQIYGRVQWSKKLRPGKRWSPQAKVGVDWDWEASVVIITSIDGFRSIAERSGQYRGQTAPEWYSLDKATGVSEWRDVFIPMRDTFGRPVTEPDVCRVGVKREGFPEPVYGVANFKSFAVYEKVKDDDQNAKPEWKLNAFWNRMPEHMIAKVAEAQAIRKAFPLLADGLYIEEEVKDPEEDTPTIPAAVTQPLPADMKPVDNQIKPGEKGPQSAPATPTAPVPGTTGTEPPPKKTGRKTAADKAAEAAAAAAGKPTETPAATTQPTATTAPSEAPVETATAQPAAEGQNEEWKDYEICQITIQEFAGRKLGSLTEAQIAKLKTGWVDKYAENIKKNPAKVKEAQMISHAFAALAAAK